ncbi:MAG: OB-fold nucleic acid binding domain-containing protein [Desulfosporosinus sp.]|nr:OB-fold nucleic acid binding domain-containing protein [Desulfosporosinus sp.]
MSMLLMSKFKVAVIILLLLTVILFKTLPLIKNGINTVSKYQSQQIQSIQEIEQNVNVGKRYEAVLTVTKFNIDPKTQAKFIAVSDGSNSIDAVIFKEVEDIPIIKVDSKYKVTGILNIYKSKYELIVRKIEDPTK